MLEYLASQRGRLAQPVVGRLSYQFTDLRVHRADPREGARRRRKLSLVL